MVCSHNNNRALVTSFTLAPLHNAVVWTHGETEHVVAHNRGDTVQQKLQLVLRVWFRFLPHNLL